jgi:hypothetical protein
VLAVSGAEMRAEAEADRKRCCSVGQSWGPLGYRLAYAPHEYRVVRDRQDEPP